MSMNLMTAYHVARYFKRQEDKDKANGWKPEKDGPCYIEKRRVIQTLNRNANLNETIDAMVSSGLLVEDGKGERGSARHLALSITGCEFLNNFLKGLEFVYRVSTATWIDFASKVDDKGRDRALELERVLRHYIHGGELISGGTNYVPPLASVGANFASDSVQF